MRGEEIKKGEKIANVNAVNMSIMNTGPTLVALAAFGIYAGIMKKPMVPEVIFPALTLFSLLRFPVMFYPRCLSLCADAIVALRRLQKYFLLPEAAATTMELGSDVDDKKGQGPATRNGASNGAGHDDEDDEDVSVRSNLRQSIGGIKSNEVELSDMRSPGPSRRGASIARERSQSVSEPDALVASISGGHFNWTAPGPTEQPFLKDINLELRRGSAHRGGRARGLAESRLSSPRSSGTCTSATDRTALRAFAAPPTSTGRSPTSRRLPGCNPSRSKKTSYSAKPWTPIGTARRSTWRAWAPT